MRELIFGQSEEQGAYPMDEEGQEFNRHMILDSFKLSSIFHRWYGFICDLYGDSMIDRFYYII